MRSTSKLVAFLILVVVFSSLVRAATVTGNVKGPDNTPFEGAFVQAINAKTHISVSVLTDKQGRYRVENLPAGEYQVRVRRSEEHTSELQSHSDLVCRLLLE